MLSLALLSNVVVAPTLLVLTLASAVFSILPLSNKLTKSPAVIELFAVNLV